MEGAAGEGDSAKANDFKAFTNDIKERGLHTPVHVIADPKGEREFFLIAGFRRTAACDAIYEGSEDYPIPVMVLPLSLEEARLANTLENLTQKRLTPYEVGRMILLWKVEYSKTASEVAALTGLGEKYCNNLARAHRELCPELLALWKGGAQGCTTDRMVKLAGVATVNQLATYRESVRDKDSTPGGATDPIVKAPTVRSMVVLEATIEHIKKGKGIDPAARKLILDVLFYATGQSASLCGFDPVQVKAEIAKAEKIASLEAKLKAAKA
jgi:hypothetical protein